MTSGTRVPTLGARDRAPWPASSPATPPLPPDPMTEQPEPWEAELHAATTAPDVPERVRAALADGLTELALLRQISVGDTLLRQRQWTRAKAVTEAWRGLPERNRNALPEHLRRALDELSSAVR